MEYGGTSPNRTVYASPLSGLGLRKNAVGLRPWCVFSPPHFCGCWNATRSFIATAKTSYTAGTLCAIWAKIVGILEKYVLTKNNNCNIVNKGV
jgi:hypothetical protein